MKNVCKQQNSVWVTIRDTTQFSRSEKHGSQSRCRAETEKKFRFSFSCFPLLFCFGWWCGVVVVVVKTMASKPFNGLKVFRFEWRLLSYIHLLFRPKRPVYRHFQSHLTFCSATPTNTKISFPSFSSLSTSWPPIPFVQTSTFGPNFISSFAVWCADGVLVVLMRLPSVVAVAAVVNDHADSCWLVLSFYLCASLFQRE